ncbi:GerAB/ArcD/ProY family transporter [Tepidibacter hydrothermalis]|uniref:Endospore germination permease n=1 Tax=Tepidibacter hydrothermalis TaxID=3036126 RepID=A0ABY8EDR3_9FIRM|nr:endospore germination permease [Tepidibacter hydrothermalis]WFD11088.1 endospore germination permease [Tepidibacter hydrothermalis]
MNKEVISDKQGISIVILFIIGSTSIFVMGLEAKQDVWLAFILAILMVLPMLIIYSRLHYIFPHKDLFDILEICFGKFIGKIMILLYTWFVFFFASDILVNYGQFIRIVNLQNTPQIIPIISLCILCAWGIKEGIEILGKWAEFFVLIPIISFFIMIILLIPDMNIDNITPILGEGFKPVLKGAFSAFTFPLVQIVVFTMGFFSFKTKKSPYKIYIIGLLIGGIFVSILSITNILVIGVNTATNVYYPTHATASKVELGNLFQGAEVIVFLTFILGGFIKISILLLCICKGITKVFGYKDYRFIITPISLLVINLSYFQYDSILYYYEFNTDIWPYYHFPFQVIFPIIIWITAEIKKKDQLN